MKLVKVPFGKSGTIGRINYNDIQTFVKFESATDFKGFELYIALSSTSTMNCFASMFKRKLDMCMMNCDDCLRRFNETSTN